MFLTFLGCLIHLLVAFFVICSRVSAISFARSSSSIYTAGADGMICEIDSLTGNLLGKFKASTKAISSMSVSAGMILCLCVYNMCIYNVFIWPLFYICCAAIAQSNALSSQ